MNVRDITNELLDEHRLSNSSAAEETDLSAASVRRHQIHDFDARLKDLDGSHLVFQGGRGPVNGQTRRIIHFGLVVYGLSKYVKDTSQRLGADRNGSNWAST